MKRRHRSPAYEIHLRYHHYAKAREEAFQEYLENRTPQEYNRSIGAYIADQIVHAANLEESLARIRAEIAVTCTCSEFTYDLTLPCPVCEPL